jgi:carbon-monoxide dehydrogenase large subunit
VHTDANLGAYLSTFSTAVPTILYATLLAGQYTTPQIHVEVDAWFTNTAPVDAYRGAGRPEATYLLERLVSRCAWEMNLGQDEIRKRNFITTFPYQTPVALQYDTGDYHACMDKAKVLAEVDGFAARRKARAKPRASCAASATAATSRPAASHRRTSPARWARGPACSSAARSACTPPAA